jgi:membrane-bound inhibitor of C-type lysozyme
MPDIKYLTIKNFKGKNIKASAADMDHHQCQDIRDFEISTKPGSLKLGWGYEIATDILGTNYNATNFMTDNDTVGVGRLSAIENIFEWRTGRDSPNDLLYIAFATDGTEDRLYYWDNSNSRWQHLDDDTAIGTYDKARFYHRQDALLVASGLGATNYPVFVKYYAADGYFGDTDNMSAGYYDYRNYLPWDSNFSISDSTDYTGGGDLESGRYYYYGALVYDDAQIGDISDVLADDGPADGESVALVASISSDNGDAVSRRVTHLNIYRQKVFTTFPVDRTEYPTWRDGYLLASLPLDNDTIALHNNFSSSGNYTTDGGLTGLSDFSNIAADMFIGMFVEAWVAGGSKEYKRITDNDTSTLTLASELSAEGYYFFNIVSYWWTNGNNYECYVLDSIKDLETVVTDHANRNTQKATPINYKYMAIYRGRTFVAPVYLVDDAETHKNWVAVSNINGDGNFEHDVFANYINLEDFGVTEITGLGILLEFLVIASTKDIHKINISSGSEFNWSLEETIQDVGCIAPDSWMFIVGDEFKHSGFYYVAVDGFRVYDGYKSVLISPPIEDVANYPLNVTTLSEAVSTYDDKLKQWIISFLTDTKTFKYDLRAGEWLQPVYDDAMREFAMTVDGETLALDNSTSKIYVLHNDGSNNLTAYDDGGLDPYWKSKVYDMGDSGKWKVAHELTMRYSANKTVHFRWYLDKGSALTWVTDPYTDTTDTVKAKTVGMPLGTRFYQIEFEAKVDSDDASGCTDLVDPNFNQRVIDQLNNLYVKVNRSDRVVSVIEERIRPSGGSGGGGTITLPDHQHTIASGDGSQLDWDVCWLDAVHTHQSNAEGGTLDHGAALTGLTDDDHTQYILADGTRPFSDYIDIDESSIPGTPGANVMRLYAESIQGFPFLSFKDDGGMVRRLVRDSIILVYNDSGSTIAASRIVYASGSSSDVPTIALAKADSASTMPAIGVTIESIANSAFGRVMQVGLLENVNTLAYDAGDIFYVSSTTAGIPTTTPPTYPNIRQEIGTVLADSATVGSIQIVARSAFNDAVIDHGGLIGLTDNDHPQYKSFAFFMG